MATKTTKTVPPKGKDFAPTFKKYGNMTPGEQAAFKQGCITVGNKVKENLGLKQKK